MKVKSDFVTNSSSSSFVAWGIRTDEDEIRNKLNEDLEKFKLAHNIEPEEDDFWMLTEFLHEYFKKYGLDACRRIDFGDILIGIQVKEMKNDETLLEFKKRVHHSLVESGFSIPPSHLEYIEESWMNN